MKRGAIVLAVVSALSACGDDRYGTYFDVHATSKEMEFDRLDFAFGVGASVGGGQQVPAVPIVGSSTITVQPPPTPGLLFQRSMDPVPSDMQTFSAARDEFTYYVDSSPENRELGYLLVRAYLGDSPTPVGYAESVYFETPTHEVAIYDLPLQPYDQSFNTWGDDVKCVRHDRINGDGEKEAIVLARHDDSDCDAFKDDVNDCAPLVYCDTDTERGCSANLECVTPDANDNACRLSTQSCDNMNPTTSTCAQAGPGNPLGVCLPDINCACDPTLPQEEFLVCAFASSEGHPSRDLDVPGPSSGHICIPATVLFEITDPISNSVIPCVDPQKLAVVYPEGTEPPQKYNFEIAGSPDTSHCIITISPVALGSNLFPAIPHLVVSVADSVGNRIGFVVGLAATGALACDGAPDDIQKNTAPVGSCTQH
ncbi:MAG TPA: hypothetical protein VGM90_33985 [Kofleriaceae bacterium]